MTRGGGAQDVLADIMAWADRQEDIRAVVLTGSRARPNGEADRWSDYDIELFSRVPERYESCDWMSAVRPVWVCLPLSRDDDVRYRMRLTVFEGGTKVDFAVAPLAVLAEHVQRGRLPPVYERGYRVLLDRDGIAAGLPAPGRGLPPAVRPSQAEFLAVIEEFWFEASEIPKYLARDEPWVVKTRDWTMKTMLLRMLEWYAVARDETADVWEIGRHMQTWLPADVYERLDSVFGRWDRADAWRALLATCAVFRDVSLVTAQALGFEYPEPLDTAISRYVQAFQEELTPLQDHPG